MARSVTIAELEAAVRWQADVERADLRHTSVKLRLVINNSIQRFRETVSGEGNHYFMAHHYGNLPIGRATDADSGVELAWSEIDTSEFDPEVVRFYGFDVKVGNYWQELEPVTFTERNWDQTLTSAGRYPAAWFNYDETKIGITPTSDSAYDFVIHYLPRLPQLVNDGDEFNPGLPGAEEWIIWDVMTKVMVRDHFPGGYGAVEAKLKELMVDILHKAGKHQSGKPSKRLDTRGAARNRRMNWRRWGNKL